MSDELQEKTEPPTLKRLAEARNKGHVAKSKDIIIAILLLTNMLVMLFCSSFMYRRFSNIAIFLYNNLLFDYQDQNVAAYWFRTGITEISIILLPMLFFVFFVGIFINVIQTGFIFSLEPIIPQWKKINIFNLENYKKYYRFGTVLRIMLGQTRFITVTIASWIIVSGDMHNIYRMSNATSQQVLMYIFKRAMLVGIFLACAFFCIGIIDFFYQRWRFYRDHMMSKREVEDERKLTEGDVGRRKRALGRQRKLIYLQARHALPNSTAIVTDQAMHYAVAIKYLPKKMRTPICTCVGKDERAKALVMIARKMQIPVVENGKIAKYLFKDLEPRQLIPAKHFRKVAEVLTKLEEK